MRLPHIHFHRHSTLTKDNRKLILCHRFGWIFRAYLEDDQGVREIALADLEVLQ